MAAFYIGGWLKRKSGRSLMHYAASNKYKIIGIDRGIISTEYKCSYCGEFHECIHMLRGNCEPITIGMYSSLTDEVLS